MYTEQQKECISSIVATQQNIVSKYKSDLIQQLGRLIATIYPDRKTEAVLQKSGKSVAIKVDFMEELLQDRVTFHELSATGQEPKRLPYKDIPLSDIETLFKKLSKVS